MFYIHGGASGKKKAIREIFELSNDRDDRDDRDDRETELDDNNRTRSRSRSRSRSRISRQSYGSDLDSDTETDTSVWNDDPETEEVETEADALVVNHDYITTIGNTTLDDFHYRYQFIEDELEYDIEEFAEQHPDIKHYEMIIYKINNTASLPFLEFLFYYENEVCKLPHYKHRPNKHIRNECDKIMGQLFVGKYRYKGYIYDLLSNKCIIFYEKYFQEVRNLSYLVTLHKSNWFWITIHEIIYQRKYMSLPIDDETVGFFIAYPMAGVLQATVPITEEERIQGRHRDRFQTFHIEAPSILYYGSTFCYVENTALYGLKREPLTSRFGPFYYFTTLDHAYYWACYHNASQRSAHTDKNTQAGILRYAVFTKRMKTVFSDDDFDLDMVKKYVERKNIFETKINQYRQTQEKYRHDKYDSIYSYDYTWTTDYDTIYNGFYDTKRRIRPVWCVCDHRNFQLLSHYEVDTRNIPDTYHPTYSGYTIM